jgi:serine/threonine protein kinase
MGKDNEDHLVYVIDFGISKIFRDQNGRHISFKEDKPFIGTTRYASIAAHIGHELGRKDDLESLAYVMIFLLKGILPW